MLGGDLDLLRRARGLLERRYGRLDAASQPVAFDHTSYYEPEMGLGLHRQFLSFETLISPDQLVDIKRDTNELEARIARETADPLIPRPVNLDPGYVDLGKVVLATTKDRAHRIYVGSGLYAEVTLIFESGAWQALNWTFPDFRRPDTQAWLVEVRELLRSARAHRRETPSPPTHSIQPTDDAQPIPLAPDCPPESG